MFDGGGVVIPAVTVDARSHSRGPVRHRRLQSWSCSYGRASTCTSLVRGRTLQRRRRAHTDALVHAHGDTIHTHVSRMHSLRTLTRPVVCTHGLLN